MLALERTMGIAKVVRLDLGDQQYVIDIRDILEIIFYRPSVPVPHAPSCLQGVIDLRGVVIPLIDLRERLGISAPARGVPAHILIVRLGDGAVGLVVDSVREVLEVEPGAVQVPDAASASGRALFRAVCRVHDQLLLLVDVDRLVSSEERKALAEVL